MAAGLVLTTMLVPVGIAYAVASGVPGIHGLYATIAGLLAVWLEVAFSASLLTQVLVTGPFMLLTCIPPLRPLKGWLVASQYFYKAEEGKVVRRQAGT